MQFLQTGIIDYYKIGRFYWHLKLRGFSLGGLRVTTQTHLVRSTHQNNLIELSGELSLTKCNRRLKKHRPGIARGCETTKIGLYQRINQSLQRLTRRRITENRAYLRKRTAYCLLNPGFQSWNSLIQQLCRRIRIVNRIAETRQISADLRLPRPNEPCDQYPIHDRRFPIPHSRRTADRPPMK